MRRTGAQQTSRLRKKGAAAAAASAAATGSGGSGNGSLTDSTKNTNRDVCHNGQIPACRLLHEAIQDVFPELKQEAQPKQQRRKGQQQQPPQQRHGEDGNDNISSPLGQLLRRKFLSLRKSHRTCPSFDTVANGTLHVEMEQSSSPEMSTTTGSTATGKKTKKRRKKKKGDGTSTTSASQGGNENSTTAAASTTFSVTEGDVDTRSIMDHSVEALDESIKGHDTKVKQETVARPSLESLPSDDDDDDLSMGRKVPEDSTSTQEDDYAKGDSMKDPLQLPYLIVSNHSDRCGDTGTGVFSNRNNHDSSLRAEDASMTNVVSDSDRVRSVFLEWLDQNFWDNENATTTTSSTITQNDWNSFLDFCNERTHGREKATGIPVQELLDVASSIDCEVCRTDALAELTRLLGETAGTVTTGTATCREESSSGDSLLPPKPSVLVLKPSVLENKASSSAGQEVSIDAAFDYVALEEGHHLPKHFIDGTDDDDEDNLLRLSETNLSFVSAVSDSSKSKPPQALKANSSNSPSSKRSLYLQTLTLQQLENFMQDWLIMGVEEDVVVSLTIQKRDKDYDEEAPTDTTKTGGGRDGGNSAPVLLSTGELHFYKKRVMEQLDDFTKSRDDMNDVKESLIQHWDSVSPTLSTAMNLEFAGYSVLKSCDDYCDKYVMESVLPILSGQLSVASCSFPNLQMKLWTLYLGALSQLLKACDVYYGRLEDELADQQGVLPKVFVSAAMRSLYRDLVQEKVSVLTDLATRLTNGLSDQVMKEWYTRVVWQESNAEEGSDESKALDLDFQDLLKELTEWTVAIQGSRMSTVNRARYAQIEKVLEILALIVDPLSREYASVGPYFSREQKMYFESLLSNIHHAYGVKRRMRLIEKQDIVSLACGAVLMWRHIRIAQSRMVISVSIPPLPLPLYQWMMLSDDPDLYGSGHNPSLCWSGWGGRRRVTCNLAGLAYFWLRERCNEWKAYVAEKELITDFEAGTPSGASQNLPDGAVPGDAGVGNSNKRKKKKKKTGGSSTVDGSHIDAAITAEVTAEGDSKSQTAVDSVVTLVGDGHESSMLDSINHNSDPLEDESNELIHADTAPRSESPSPSLTDMDGPFARIDSDVANTNGGEINRNGDVLHDGEAEGVDLAIDNNDESYVAVQDEEEMVSARDFLIERLVKLLDDPESGNTVLFLR